MYLLNTRICRYTYLTPTVIYCDQDRYVMDLFNLESGLYRVPVRCISNKSWTQITPFFICSAWLYVKLLEKIIARTLCFMHQGIVRSNHIFNNDAYFFLFSRSKIPFDPF